MIFLLFTVPYFCLDLWIALVGGPRHHQILDLHTSSTIIFRSTLSELYHELTMIFSNIALIKNILEIKDIQNFHDFLFTVPYFFLRHQMKKYPRSLMLIQ